jgi:hypothetical protein
VQLFTMAATIEPQKKERETLVRALAFVMQTGTNYFASVFGVISPTHSMMASGALSPRRGPILTVRV